MEFLVDLSSHVSGNTFGFNVIKHVFVAMGLGEIPVFLTGVGCNRCVLLYEPNSVQKRA